MSRWISSAFTMRPRVMEAISSMSAVLMGLSDFFQRFTHGDDRQHDSFVRLRRTTKPPAIHLPGRLILTEAVKEPQVWSIVFHLDPARCCLPVR